jgi:hypothetical protein
MDQAENGINEHAFIKGRGAGIIRQFRLSPPSSKDSAPSRKIVGN